VHQGLQRRSGHLAQEQGRFWPTRWGVGPQLTNPQADDVVKLAADAD
jgi:hypothetical protein